MRSLTCCGLVAPLMLLAVASAAAGGGPSPVVTQRYGESLRGTVDGFPFLMLRGTHRERGEAHGFLGAREIVKTCDAMAGTVNRLGKPGEAATGWESAKQLVDHFRFPERFETELRGMLAGLEKALPTPADRTLQSTGHPIALDDLRLLQCADVLELMRCSQFSAWGALTPDGATLVARNWDYPPIFPFDTYCIFAVEPAEKGLQKTLDAMWFGMLGAGMAALNQDGVYLSGNDGGSGEDVRAIEAPTPTMLAVRMVAETARASDPLAALQEHIDQRTVLSLLYHIVGPPARRGQAPQAAIFEYTAGATTPFLSRVRRPSAALPEALILTNHRLLTGSGDDGGSGARYARIEKALTDPAARGKIGFEEARSILASVAASSPNVTTQYSAVVWPGRREMRVAVALAPGKPATGEHYARVRWDALLRLK